MELLKKVKTIEVKRCFVFSQRFTSKNMRKESVKKKIIKPSKEALLNNLDKVKKQVLKLKESSLDNVIADEYKKRLWAYNQLDWYIGIVDLTEVGIWRRTGGTPESWAKGSLKETAIRFKKELRNENSRFKKVRSIKVVPQIIKSKQIIKKEKYLMPILLPTGIIPETRKGMRKTRFYIDDGTMRTLAFTSTGDKRVKAFIGIFRNK
ncbi:hypothetical protein A2661_01040 [Candidatus Giovannonibacteria bacterium RIFCSPHIGHO2_01_FULL_45_24]|nr:MAG: hypothetical protein A2661_01040 [Candidatus Giovannonibacteria bacterium RIFCSPHIGHO2_01_FULL_45_24]